MKNPLVKILLAYHRPAMLPPADDVFVPIHVGRANTKNMTKDIFLSDTDAQWMRDNMIGDDTGENISELNHIYNEMTMIYWAWKNYDKIGNPDYIGFGHYRRAFVFDANDRQYSQDFETFSNDYLYNVHFNMLPKILDGADLVGLNPHSLIDINAVNNFEHYATSPGHIAADIQTALNVIDEKSPNLSDTAREYMSAGYSYLNNTFIMKRELFFEYAKWIFDILNAMHKETDYTNRNAQEMRMAGFTSERLTGIWQTYMEKNGAVIRRVPLAYLKKPNINISLHPAFEKNNVPVFMSFNNAYIKYASVVIQSIIDTASPENNYDIIGLSKEITSEMKSKLECMAARHPNISVRIYNPMDIFGDARFPTNKQWTIETYFRLFAQKIFDNYSKMIYLDVDTIVCRDIAELYKNDISESLLGMCQDVGVMAKVKSKKSEPAEYFTDIIGVKDVFTDYFQAGILLMNLDKMREFEFSDKCLELSNKWFNYVDQDIINKVAHGRITALDLVWNVKSDEGRSKGMLQSIPVEYYEKYMTARQNPGIIHYSSNVKTWSNNLGDMAELWWAIARRAPFYERIVATNHMVPMENKKMENKKILFDPEIVRKYKRKIKKYKLLQLLTFGMVGVFKKRKGDYSNQLAQY